MGWGGTVGYTDSFAWDQVGRAWRRLTGWRLSAAPVHVRSLQLSCARAPSDAARCSARPRRCAPSAPQAAETYVLDADMAATLRASNPQAFRNVLARCLEAAGRGLWAPQAELLEKLRRLYGEMDDELEGVK